MALDWDILLDGVSVKDQIASFQIRESKGAYARELTLFAADASFYTQFDFTVFPKLRVEVKTKTGATWISQGKFYIEQPVLTTDPYSIISQGIWGRSETAKIGSPWSVKVSKEWSSDTTCQAIMTEMADLCGLTINFETADYVVYGGTYAVDGVYPIDVIAEIAGFTGDYVGCSTSGALVIKSNVFHPSAADHTITDVDISGISESIEYPEFGNRILISAAGGNASYSVELVVLDGTDCLPADGVSSGTVLAFVTDQDGQPANNVSVDWTAESGITVDKAVTVTGDYLIDKETVNADNYYKLTVAYPVSDVIGIWKYSDTSHRNNLWDASKDGCVFEGNEIIVNDPFTYCDQTLVVSYITSGCAINTVIAGNQSIDVAVTADVGGVQSSIDIKLGNSCACGSELSVRAGSDQVCFGNYTNILVAATINNEPATGYIVKLEGDEGCGEQESWASTLGYVNVYAEIATVFNVIPSVSQIKTSMPISDSHPAPRVYRLSSINPDRYSSHEGQTIDLSYVYETGVELLVYYTAAGAATFRWKPGGSVITSEDTELYGGGCSSEITVTMADGTEQGLSTSITMSSIDCTVVTDDDPEIPDDDDDDPLPEPDPEEPDPFFPIEPIGGLDGGDDPEIPEDDDDDPEIPEDDGYPEGSDSDVDGQFPGEGSGAISPDGSATDSDDSGDSSEDGSEPEAGSSPLGEGDGESGDTSGGLVTACDSAILTKITNYDSVIGDDEKEKLRYGYQSSDDCANGFACECSELCESEMYEKGNTYDYSQTLHEQAIAEYEDGSPGYYELYEQLKADHLSECTENCESVRESNCGDCEISGTVVLDPGETAEFICSDGTVESFTMPEGACGTQTVTVGCCTFEVRSSAGKWVLTETSVYGGGTCGSCGYCGYADYSEPNSAGTKHSGSVWCFVQTESCEIGSEAQGSGTCDACANCGEGYTNKVNTRMQGYTYEWQCE